MNNNFNKKEILDGNEKYSKTKQKIKKLAIKNQGLRLKS